MIIAMMRVVMMMMMALGSVIGIVALMMDDDGVGFGDATALGWCASEYKT